MVNADRLELARQIREEFARNLDAMGYGVSGPHGPGSAKPIIEALSHAIANAIDQFVGAASREKFEKFADLLTLVSTHVDQHSKTLKGEVTQDQPQYVICYCGTKHIAGKCPTCGKVGAPVIQTATKVTLTSGTPIARRNTDYRFVWPSP